METLEFVLLATALAVIGMGGYFSLRRDSSAADEAAFGGSPQVQRLQPAALARNLLRYHLAFSGGQRKPLQPAELARNLLRHHRALSRA